MKGSKKINWEKVAKEKKTLQRLSKELGVNEITIRRNLKKRGLKKERMYKKGDNHYMWKGENVKYGALHYWVKKNKPKPQFCDECKINLPRDLANISGKYKRDITDFEWLCRSCHMNKDGRINNLKQFQKRKQHQLKVKKSNNPTD